MTANIFFSNLIGFLISLALGIAFLGFAFQAIFGIIAIILRPVIVLNESLAKLADRASK